MNNNQNQARNTPQYEQPDYTRICEELKGRYNKAVKSCPGGVEGVGAVLFSLHRGVSGEEGVIADFLHEMVLGVLGRQQGRTQILD